MGSVVIHFMQWKISTGPRFLLYDTKFMSLTRAYIKSLVLTTNKFKTYSSTMFIDLYSYFSNMDCLLRFFDWAQLMIIRDKDECCGVNRLRFFFLVKTQNYVKLYVISFNDLLIVVHCYKIHWVLLFLVSTPQMWLSNNVTV